MKRVVFHVYAGNAQYDMRNGTNREFADERKAWNVYRYWKGRAPYAEIARREWDDSTVFDENGNWLSAGCKNGCCRFTLTSLESKGKANG